MKPLNERRFEDIEEARESARFADSDAVQNLMDREGLTKGEAWARLKQQKEDAAAEDAEAYEQQCKDWEENYGR